MKRRALRNFGRLVQATVGAPVLAAIFIPVARMRLSWSSDRLVDWILPAIGLIAIVICLWSAALQAQRIRSFVPLKVAAAAWRQHIVRVIFPGRGRRPSQAWLYLAPPLVFLPPIALSWFDLQDRIAGPGAAWPVVSFYLISLPLMGIVLKRVSAASRPVPATAQAAVPPETTSVWKRYRMVPVLAISPTLLFMLLYTRWADAREFAPALTTREVVTATVSGRCSRGRGVKWMMRHCARAETSAGTPVEWAIRLDRHAQDIHVREGRVCLRVAIERASDGAMRIEGGSRRYLAQDLVPCQSRFR